MTSSEDCGFTFTWIIENIDCLAPHAQLNSSEFVANCLHGTKWQLGCVLRPSDDRKKIEKCLVLTKVQTEPYHVHVCFEFSVFDANNEKLETFRVGRFSFHRGNSCGCFQLRRIDGYFSKIKTIRCRLWESGTDNISEKGFGRTRICLERRFFMWTIKEISLLGHKASYMTINSKKYPSKGINLVLNTSRKCAKKLQVELINNFICERLCEYGPCSPYPYIQDCEISIVDYKGNSMVFPNQEKWKTSEGSYFGPKGQSHDKYYFQFPLDTSNEELAETCLQNDSVTFQCECGICFGAESNLLEDANSVPNANDDETEKRRDCYKNETSSNTPNSNFIKDMQQLCEEKQFCDFSLKADTEIFPVHRAILSVRSPVFKAMFSHDMKESSNQSVDIPDLNAGTVRRMLAYIYTDTVDDIMWKDAFDLYIAGDKYEMLNLKERCSAILKANLHPSNVCEILVLADERHDGNLKRAAQDYVVDHDVEIIHLDSWKNIERKHANLGIDILRQIVIKRQTV